jgi:hypothetical protein
MGIQLEPVPTADGERSDSVVDAIRDAFAATKAPGPKHLDLPIPLRENVRMRFHAIGRDLYDELQQSDDKDTNLDFVAAACECILLKDGGQWRPAVNDGVPVKFDGSLAQAMGWHAESPRDEVLKAFGEVPLPYLAIAEHVALVQAWMAGRAEQREEAVLGES